MAMRNSEATNFEIIVFNWNSEGRNIILQQNDIKPTLHKVKTINMWGKLPTENAH